MIFGELVRRLNLIAGRGGADPEVDHADADELLLKWIEQEARSGEATVAFERIRKCA